MPFTNILVGLFLFAFTVILRVSLSVLKRTAMLHLPRPNIRPIDAGQSAYGILYQLVSEVLVMLCQAADWATCAAAVLFTVFLFCGLAWTAMFTVLVLGDLAMTVAPVLNALEVLIGVYVRIALWMLCHLLEALAYVLRLLLAVA